MQSLPMPVTVPADPIAAARQPCRDQLDRLHDDGFGIRSLRAAGNDERVIDGYETQAMAGSCEQLLAMSLASMEGDA